MKVDNYDYKLIEWVNTQLGKPYVWGVTDCGSLVRQGLNIVYGKDKFNDIPTWNTEEMCRKIWDDLGGVDKAFLDFGAKKIKGTFAQTGDIIVITANSAAGLIINSKILFSSIEKGIIFRDIAFILSKVTSQFYRFS
mgnify:FL=1